MVDLDAEWEIEDVMNFAMQGNLPTAIWEIEKKLTDVKERIISVSN